MIVVGGILAAVIVVLGVLLGLSVVPVTGPIVGALFILTVLAGAGTWYWRAPSP